ncbi:hypothetical protein B296_00024859 [Ensete ventricosum]|uniref:Uncharacterized protein n=1 Tax=Ensete ventricosum TaxID=4639 RepID=A0A427AU94_ENSVE|nr:hypothetical protein B296_00024859 [Ensete ventricosum]
MLNEIAPPLLVENTQLLTHLVHFRAHERLQQLESEFALVAHLRLIGAKVRLAPSCSIRHDASPWQDYETSSLFIRIACPL